ncbi:MAG: DUF983 domain-containing protein [Flavobacteriales bacterium]|jgi:uncharacterized protein (DUF983 family)|nr:DUF983 domain-containing protein [Flavobacteriales bacterium]
MTKNQALVKSVLEHKCPKCVQSKMYVEPNPYKAATMTKMHLNCPSCGFNFYPEPGFYFGAMYITYALVAGEFIILFLLKTFLGLELGIWQFVGILLGFLLIMAPINFRFSRVIWLNLFSSYDEEVANKVKNNK